MGGTVLVLGALLVGRVAGRYCRTERLALLPLVVAAFVKGWFVPSITVAQHHGQWGRLSRIESIGGMLSLIVAVPLLPFAGLVAGVLQTLVAETVFAVRPGRGLGARA